MERPAKAKKGDSGKKGHSKGGHQHGAKKEHGHNKKDGQRRGVKREREGEDAGASRRAQFNKVEMRRLGQGPWGLTLVSIRPRWRARLVSPMQSWWRRPSASTTSSNPTM
jgi:hypothetical protein